MKRQCYISPLKREMSLAGFTLIEMLLVVVVISIIAVLSVPNFSKAYQGIILKKQADDIVYLMRYAQSRAINLNKPMKFVFDEDLSSYRILEAESGEYVDVEELAFSPFGSRLSRTRKVNKEIDIESDAQSIYFYPGGEIDRLSFEVCNTHKCFAVSTNIQRSNVKLLGPVNNE